MNYRRITDPRPAPAIRFTWNGRAVEARRGDSVATALLLAGVETTRTSAVSGSARCPYCMMGVCFECLVEIDGVPNRQACLTPVTDGMSVRTETGAPDLDHAL